MSQEIDCVGTDVPICPVCGYCLSENSYSEYEYRKVICDCCGRSIKVQRTKRVEYQYTTSEDKTGKVNAKSG